MEGMVSTLSISKNLFLISLILLFLGGGGFSCSQKKPVVPKSEPKASIPKKEEIKEEIKEVAASIDSGPSKEPAPNTFQDYTKEWGLEGLSATHLYAVDWNNDGYVDLVTLPEYYGPPQFLVGNKSGFQN
jgi:hypothetical protein